MQLEDWLDDLCVRFIINLPPEELESVERICFQVEEAQWFYEDFIRPLDPSLPSLSLRAFSLRIFQHCPLFSQWSAQHHTTAFAEFLAYKSRVPVRGAIMLNEAMDEVVLVKGWKKGANWSFPRGKINKDENDLDCAIREVYEETGLDLQSAGLAKDEKDMKYIEVTMREQHMRLYVFRGVPKDTHFEPRTRKEISKIEWYKLNDLPTLKKNRHQENDTGEIPTINANKFYMVAPFLHPLKKWIAQQKKKENRYSSNLAGPPMVLEDVAGESEALDFGHGLTGTSSFPGPSDLPEVTISRSHEQTAQLKELLNIQPAHPQYPMPVAHPGHVPQVDAAKSNALLALLRGQPPELQAGPHTPLEQITNVPDSVLSPHRSHVQAHPSAITQPPLPFAHQAGNSMSQSNHLTWPHQPNHQIPPNTTNALPPIGLQPPFAPQPQHESRPLHTLAPYQQTGDPVFNERPNNHQGPSVPPASALPKLTNHTKALLDVFRTGPIAQPAPRPVPLTAKGQSLLDILKDAPKPSGTMASSTTTLDQRGETIAESAIPIQFFQKPTQQANLLDLFRPQQDPSPLSSNPVGSGYQSEVPAELAANPPQGNDKKSNNDDLLLSLLKQESQGAGKLAPLTTPRMQRSPREGETSATISGPLNQPAFDSLPKVPRQIPDGMGRSPLTTHRTLYDPNQPSVKILARPDEQRSGSTKSPRPAKSKQGTSSPKRATKQTPKEAPKPFQPQILRRPQTAEEGKSSDQIENQFATHQATERAVQTNTATVSDHGSEDRELVQSQQIPIRPQGDDHKQRLLSLFGGTVPATTKPPQSQGHVPSRVVSPLSNSQMMSPTADAPVSAIEPISTRSRMGSMASVSSITTSARPPFEKRQTAAENKAFILGYLGRIASQEG